MRRREFIAMLGGTAMAPCFTAKAQQETRVWRIGYLTGTSRAATNQYNFGAFVEGLRELGYLDGKNITLDLRLAEGRIERLPELARDLVRSRPDVIVTATNGAAVAVQQATNDIPIVVLSSHDGVGVGLYASLSRPGRNITGVESIAPELNTKRLELLKSVVPGLSRISDLYNVAFPSIPQHVAAIAATARSLGLEVSHYEVSSLADFDATFSALKRDRAEALLVVADPLTFSVREQTMRFALENRLPGIYEFRAFVDAGGLMSYGPSQTAVYRRGAYYVDKILRGAKPGDLPVEQPTQFEFVLNAKTARAIGIDIPASVLVNADEVIE